MLTFGLARALPVCILAAMQFQDATKYQNPAQKPERITTSIVVDSSHRSVAIFRAGGGLDQLDPDTFVVQTKIKDIWQRWFPRSGVLSAAGLFYLGFLPYEERTQTEGLLNGIAVFTTASWNEITTSSTALPFLEPCNKPKRASALHRQLESSKHNSDRYIYDASTQNYCGWRRAVADSRTAIARGLRYFLFTSRPLWKIIAIFSVLLMSVVGSASRTMRSASLPAWRVPVFSLTRSISALTAVAL
jgi:hypothetical protein